MIPMRAAPPQILGREIRPLAAPGPPAVPQTQVLRRAAVPPGRPQQPMRAARATGQRTMAPRKPTLADTAQATPAIMTAARRRRTSDNNCRTPRSFVNPATARQTCRAVALVDVDSSIDIPLAGAEARGGDCSRLKLGRDELVAWKRPTDSGEQPRQQRDSLPH